MGRVDCSIARVPVYPRKSPKPVVWLCKLNQIRHRPEDYGTRVSTEYGISYVRMVKDFDPEIKGMVLGKEEKLGTRKGYDGRRASCMKTAHVQTHIIPTRRAAVGWLRRYTATYQTWAAHSQDFVEFDFIDLLTIFNTKNHSLGVAAC